MIPLRMAAYCRVSTQKQTQLDSLAHQRLFFCIVCAQQSAALDAYLRGCGHFRQTNAQQDGIFTHAGRCTGGCI